jgi:hypothetical protein
MPGSTADNLPESGRVSAIAVDPSTPSTIYLGAASGGVWKSTDGGQSWTPKTDSVTTATGNPVTMSVGAIAVAPSNTQTIYVGTGEADFQGDPTPAGQGVLKSTDGSNTWTLESGNPGKNEFIGADISAIVVDPRDSNHLFVSVANGGGGIWESTDGGSRWNNLKMTNPNVNNNQSFNSSAASITALVMDPDNPDTLFAAAGWYQGNQYGGVYRRTIDATDNGSVFAFMPNFLSPQGGAASTANQLGRISLAEGGSSYGNYLYAMVGAASSKSPWTLYEVLKTTNAEASDVTTINWQFLSDANRDTAIAGTLLDGQANYGNVLTVDPTNPTTVYAAGYTVWYSTDGGQSTDGSTSWDRLSNGTGDTLPNGQPAPILHNDQHAFAWIPGTDTLLVGTDGGIFELNGIANNPDQSAPATHSKLGLWASLNDNLQITQFYDIALNPQSQRVAYGAAQDNGVSQFTGGAAWTNELIGDGLGLAVNPSNPRRVYAVHNPGVPAVYRADDGTTFNSIQQSMPSGDFVAGGKFALDPGAGSNGNDLLIYTVVVTDSQGNDIGVRDLYESTDSGGTWNPITTQRSSNWPIAAAGTSNFFVDAVAADQVFNPDTLQFQTMILALGGQAGSTTNSGEISLDGGTDWLALSNTPKGTTERLVFDPLNSDLVYAVTGGKVYQGIISFNFSASPATASVSWTALPTTGLPPGTGIHSLAIDDRYGGRTLYAGTDYGVYGVATQPVSGVESSWYRYGDGLPNVRVESVELAPGLNVLAAGTYGRGLWEVQAGVTVSFSRLGPGTSVGDLTVQGDGNSDNITLQLDPSDSSELQVLAAAPGSILPSLLAEYPVANLNQIEVNGGSGNDTLTVDDRYGNVPVNIAYTGGDGTNALNVVGGTFDKEKDDLFSARSGTIRFNEAQGPVIDYSNVDSIDDTTAVNDYQVVDAIPGLFQELGVGYATSPLGPVVTTITGSQAVFLTNLTTPFTTIYLDNKNNLTVRGPADPVTFDVTYAAPSPLTLKGQSGQDTFNINYAFNENTITVQDSGPTQQSTLNINDQQNQDDPGTTGYAISAASVERTGTQTTSGGPGGEITFFDDVMIPYSNMGFVNINGGANGNTFNVQSSAAGTATAIIGGSAGDTVNVGNSTDGVQDIAGTLNIENPAAPSTVNVDDSADTSAPTFTLSTLGVNPDDSEYSLGNTDTWGQISGLPGGGLINYEYADTRSLTLQTGGGATVNVLATGPRVITNLVGRRTPPGFADKDTTVNVGNGSLAGIAGTLNIENPTWFSDITVHDSSDTLANLLLNTIGPNGADSQGDTDPWGQISGLPSGAVIDYEYPDTRSLTLKTGPLATVNVHAVGVTTNLIGTYGTTVKVGNGGRLAGIAGTLNIENVSGYSDVTVDDSTDPFGPTFTLSTLGVNPADTEYSQGNTDTWGQISSLASGANINYEYSNTLRLTLQTGAGATVDVLATGVATYVVGNGPTTVNVGDQNNVQGISSSLYVQNAVPGQGTVDINDSQDPTTVPSRVTLDQYQDPATGLLYESISNLSLAAPIYVEDSVSSLTVHDNSAGNTFYVRATAALPKGTTLDAGAGGDTFDVGSAANILDPIQGGVTVNGQGSNTTLNILDQGNSSPQRYEYDVYADHVVRIPQPQGSPTQTITYSGIANLTVHGSNADSDLLGVVATPLGTMVAVYAGSGRSDEFVVDDSFNGLNSIRGPLALHGASLSDIALLNEFRNPSGHTYTLSTPNPTTTLLQRDGIAAITSDGIGELLVDDPLVGGSQVNVQGTLASTPVAIAAGLGGDTINVGSAANTLDPIQGGVTVNGQGANTTLNVHDDGTLTSQDYGVYAASIHRFNVDSPFADNIAPIGYQQIANLNLYLGQALSGPNAGPIRNIADVFSTARGTTTTVNGGSGQNDVTVAPFDAQPGIPLDNSGIQGAVSVHGGGNTYDTLTYYDFLDPQAQTYSMTATQITDVTAVGFAPVTFDANVHFAGLYTSLQGSNTVQLLRTAATTYSTGIDAESNDTVTVGTSTPQGMTLANLLGSIVSIGTNTPTQSAKVTLDDSGDTQTGRQVTFGNYGGYGWAVQGLSPAVIAVNPGTGSTINVLGSSPPSGATLGNNYTIQSTLPGVALTVTGGTGNNTLQGPNTANTWQVTGANAGTLDGTVAFTGMESLIGGSAGNTFQFHTGGSLAGTINGGGGTNTLDYSAYQGDILVDLLLNNANLVGQGVSNMANVIGSQGNSLIVGDANTTSLVGGTGRNVLIGGGGTETITGGGGFNLLIGGKTVYDSGANALAALQALQQYWDNPRATTLDSLVTPLKSKKGVTVNGQVLMLNSSTVQDDNAVDSLLGGGGANWFIRDKEDTINNGSGPGKNDRLLVI